MGLSDIVVNNYNSNFFSDYKSAVNNDSKKNLAKAYSDNSKVKKDSEEDSKENQDTISAITGNVKSSTNNKEAMDFASKKAENLQKDGAKFGSYTVDGASSKNNEVTFEIKDEKGNKGQGGIKYGSDGSYTTVASINDTLTEQVFGLDKEGKTIRRQKKTASPDGKISVIEYDDTGKANKKVITSKNNKNYKETIFYDDNGLAVYKTINDGTTTKTVQYEYDKEGKRIGSHTVCKNNSTNKERYRSYSAIDSNTKTTTKYDKKGNKIVNEYTKNADGKWELKSTTKTPKDKDGKETKKIITSTKTNSDGTTTREVKVKKGNKTYFETQTVNEDGKITNIVRKDKDGNLISKKTYKYDENGYKTKTITTKYNDKGKKSKEVTNSFDAKTGELNGSETTRFNKGEKASTSETKYNDDGNKETKTVVKYEKNGKETVKAVSEYDSDGKIKNKIKYTKKGGKWVKTAKISYWENGKINVAEEYNKEGKVSATTYYDKEGKKLKSDEKPEVEEDRDDFIVAEEE